MRPLTAARLGCGCVSIGHCRRNPAPRGLRSRRCRPLPICARVGRGFGVGVGRAILARLRCCRGPHDRQVRFGPRRLASGSPSVAQRAKEGPTVRRCSRQVWCAQSARRNRSRTPAVVGAGYPGWSMGRVRNAPRRLWPAGSPACGLLAVPVLRLAPNLCEAAAVRHRPCCQPDTCHARHLLFCRIGTAAQEECREALAFAARVPLLVCSHGYRGYPRIMVGLIPAGGSTRPAVRAIRVIRSEHNRCAGITREPRPERAAP
jgi:hypothetical protein